MAEQQEATIVRVWTDTVQAHMAVAVNEDGAQDENGKPIMTEYTGSVPLALYNELDAKHQEAVLLAAVKVVRNAQRPAVIEVKTGGRIAL